MKSSNQVKTYPMPGHFFRKFILITMCFVFGSAFCQERTITGKVVDEQGVPMLGVNVMVKESNLGTQTDFDGNFSISAETGDTIVFSYVGMTTQEVTIGDSNNLNIVIEVDSQALDEIVVVGYGIQKKSDVDQFCVICCAEN